MKLFLLVFIWLLLCSGWQVSKGQTLYFDSSYCSMDISEAAFSFTQSKSTQEAEIKSANLKRMMLYCPAKGDSVVHIFLSDSTISDAIKVISIKPVIFSMSVSNRKMIDQIIDNSEEFEGLNYMSYLDHQDSVKSIKYQLALEYDPGVFSELHEDLNGRRPQISKKTFRKLNPVIALINLGDDRLEDKLLDSINNVFGELYKKSILRSQEYGIEKDIFQILAKIKTSNSAKKTIYLLDRWDNEENGYDWLLPSTAALYYYTVLVNKASGVFYSNLAQNFNKDNLFPPELRDQFIVSIKDKVNTNPTIWNSDIRNNINYDEP